MSVYVNCKPSSSIVLVLSVAAELFMFYLEVKQEPKSPNSDSKSLAESTDCSDFAFGRHVLSSIDICVMYVEREYSHGSRCQCQHSSTVEASQKVGSSLSSCSKGKV